MFDEFFSMNLEEKDNFERNCLSIINEQVNCNCGSCIICKNGKLKTFMADALANSTYDYYNETMKIVKDYESKGRYPSVIKKLTELFNKMIQDLNIFKKNNYKTSNQSYIKIKDEKDYRNKLLVVVTKLVDCCYNEKEFYQAESVISYVVNQQLIDDIEIFKQGYTLGSIEYEKENYEMAHEYFVNLVNGIHLVNNCEIMVILKMRLKYCFVLFKLARYEKFLIEFKKIKVDEIKELLNDFYHDYISAENVKNINDRNKVKKLFGNLEKGVIAIINIYAKEDIPNHKKDISEIIRFIEKFIA